MLLFLNRRLKPGVFACFLSIAAVTAHADTVVTNDGRWVNGSLQKTADGYIVQTSDGPVEVSNTQIVRIIQDKPTITSDTPHAAASSTPSPAPAAIHGKKKIDPRTFDKLVEQGNDALASGDYAAARDAFNDALTIQPTSAPASRGLGIAWLRLGFGQRAVKPLEIGLGTATPDRDMVINLASANVAARNPMRAVKYIKAYLEAHLTPLDESMIDALAISLSQAEPSTTKSSLFIQAAQLYSKQSEALEANRPGEKRWGTKWMPEEQVDSLMKDRQTAQANADKVAGQLNQIASDLAAAQKEKSQMAYGLGNRLYSTAELNAMDSRIANLKTQQASTQTEYDQALAAIPKPDYPSTIPAADSNAGTTVAVVTPSAPVANTDTAINPPAPTIPAPRPQPTPVLQDVATPEPTVTTPPPPSDTKPRHSVRYGAAFAVAPDLVVTSAEMINGASTLEFQTADGGDLKGEVVRTDDATGLALVRITNGKSVVLPLADTVTTGAVQCPGYPDVDLFNPTPQMMQATLEKTAEPWIVRFEKSPRLPGAPLIQHGAVIGVEMAARDSDTLHVAAVSSAQLKDFLKDDARGGTVATNPGDAVMQLVATK
jgi:tetratricopeptide (TPR) repeat protein